MRKKAPKDRPFAFYGAVPSAMAAVINHQAPPSVTVVIITDMELKFHRKQKLGNIEEFDEEETYFPTT